jgi:hypothetical protein
VEKPGMSEKRFVVENHPDLKTVAYAELWSGEPFGVQPWWTGARTVDAEAKGDERGLGMTWKCDLPGPCWAFWEGVSGGRHNVKLVEAATIQKLNNPPGTAFLPIYPGVNVLAWRDIAASILPVGPTAGHILRRVWVIAEEGTPPLAVSLAQPSSVELSMQVVERSAAWFDYWLRDEWP